MLQILHQRFGSLSGTTSARFASINEPSAWDTPEASKTSPWSVPGTFQNWSLKLTTAPGTGNSYTYVVRINGSDTALTVTISGTNTTGSDVTHTASISAGDLVTLKRTGTGTPTSSAIESSLEFSSAGNTSGYVQNGQHPGLPSSNPDAYGPCLFAIVAASGNAWDITGVVGVNFNRKIMPVGGSLTRIDVHSANGSASWVDAALPSGCTGNLVIRKNGIEQDGSGGTTDTRIALTDAASTYTWTGTFSWAAGDILDTAVHYAGTFGAFTPATKIGVCVEPATAGDFLLGMTAVESNLSVVAPNYGTVNGSTFGAIAEASVESVPALTAWFVVAMRGRSSGGGGDQATFGMRVNLADAPGVSFLMTGADATSFTDYFNLMIAGNVTDPGDAVAVGIGDTWDIQTLVAQGKRLFFGFGEFLTIQASRAAGWALDGGTHVLNTADTFAVWAASIVLEGALDLTGATITGLPASEDARSVTHQLGGSRSVAIFSASAIEVLDWLDFVPLAGEFEGATVAAQVEVRTLNAGTSVTPKIRNITDSSDAVTGSACTATNADYSGTAQRQSLSFTPVAGKRYRLMITGSNATNGIYGIGVVKVVWP